MGPVLGTMNVCKRVYYSGRVQGVGFRYTAHQLAGAHPVAGYVRNLPSGQVELVVEGEPDAVDAYLAALARRMSAYIEDVQAHEEPSAGYQSFLIRH